MSSLTGSSISSTYDRLLSLPSGGGDTVNLVALTDGDGTTTFALKLATNKADIQGTLTVGANTDGYDVKFFGNASGAYMLWDESIDDLILGGDAGMGIGTTSPSHQIDVQGTGIKTIRVLSTDDDTAVRIAAGGAAKDSFLYFDCEGDDSGARIYYSHNATPANQIMIFDVGDTNDVTAMNILGNGKIGMGDASPDAWLTINQAADNDNILSFKSSNVTHGFTSITETDTYTLFAKTDGDGGGCKMISLRDATGADASVLEFEAYGQNAASTSKSTSSRSIVEVYASLHDGSNAYADITADGNVFGVKCRRGGANVTIAVIDEDGEIHSDGGAQSAYDSYDDAHLVRSFDLSHGNNVINSKFDKFINYNHEKLAELKLVGREEDGTPNHFINVTGMQRLHNGAIWQQYEEHQKLLNAFVKLAEKTIGLDEAKALIEDNEIKKLGEV